MYAVESGGHRVAPAPTRLKKVVDYKTMNDGGGGVVVESRGGGGTHIAATVKNTVRRLLRRTKSHRDTPSSLPVNLPANRNSTVAATNDNSSVKKNIAPKITPNANDSRVKRNEQPSQPPSVTSLQMQQMQQHQQQQQQQQQQGVRRIEWRQTSAKRYARPRVRLQRLNDSEGEEV